MGIHTRFHWIVGRRGCWSRGSGGGGGWWGGGAGKACIRGSLGDGGVMVGSCGKKGLVWSVVKIGEGTVDNWILQSWSYYVITTDHSGSLSVLSVKKANIITESRLFHFVYFHVWYSWEDSTPGTLSSLIHTLNNLMKLRSVHFY